MNESQDSRAQTLNDPDKKQNDLQILRDQGADLVKEAQTLEVDSDENYDEAYAFRSATKALIKRVTELHADMKAKTWEAYKSVQRSEKKGLICDIASDCDNGTCPHHKRHMRLGVECDDEKLGIGRQCQWLTQKGVRGKAKRTRCIQLEGSVKTGQ